MSEDPRNHESISSCHYGRVAFLRGYIYIYIRRNKAHRGEGKREEEVEDSKERRGEETRSKRVDRRVGTKGTHNRYSPADSLSLSLPLRSGLADYSSNGERQLASRAEQPNARSRATTAFSTVIVASYAVPAPRWACTR